jgi:nitrate reductase (NAD(P)H)
MSTLLATTPLNSQIDIRGPTGEITYLGLGRFALETSPAQNQQPRTFKRISLILGGSGITPGYALLARIVLGEGEAAAGVRVRVLDANRTEGDILLRTELEDLEKKSNGRVKVTHVLSHPSEEWTGLKGHVDGEVIRGSLFGPGEEGAVVFLCGPPGLIRKGALPVLRGEFLLGRMLAGVCGWVY